MIFEKINDNSIRCIVEKEELLERHINVDDMAYGSKTTINFFNELMQMADMELGFTPGNPVMIEAVPLGGGSMEITVTKVEDPEELDVRFSKFTPMKVEPMNTIFDILGTAFEKLEEELKTQHMGNSLNEIGVSELKTANEENIVKIFAFRSIDDATNACKQLKNYEYDSSFYKDEKNNSYFLVLSIGVHSDKKFLDDFNKVCNTLAEYGRKVEGMSFNIAYYVEHYQEIIKNKAVEKLALL